MRCQECEGRGARAEEERHVVAIHFGQMFIVDEKGKRWHRRWPEEEFRTVFPWMGGRRIARLDAGLRRECWKYRKCKTWLWGMRKVGMRGRLRTKICQRQPSRAASTIFYFSKTRVRITIKDEEVSGKRGVLERRDFGQKLEVDSGRT